MHSCLITHTAVLFIWNFGHDHLWKLSLKGSNKLASMKNPFGQQKSRCLKNAQEEQFLLYSSPFIQVRWGPSGLDFHRLLLQKQGEKMVICAFLGQAAYTITIFTNNIFKDNIKEPIHFASFSSWVKAIWKIPDPFQHQQWICFNGKRVWNFMPLKHFILNAHRRVNRAESQEYLCQRGLWFHLKLHFSQKSCYSSFSLSWKKEVSKKKNQILFNILCSYTVRQSVLNCENKRIVRPQNLNWHGVI